MAPGTRARGALLGILAVALLFPPPASGQGITWTDQFGSIQSDDGEAVAIDAAGDVYIVGQTVGVLPGQTSAGTIDAFVRRYDASGAEVWTRQFGSWERDYAKGVTVDAPGNVYVVGQTFGTLPGQVSAGGWDAFVRKYDPAGNEVWTRQFGTGGGEGAMGVAVDAGGHTYVVGSTRAVLPGQTWGGDWDAFVRRYDPAGTEEWTRQLGGHESDHAVSVAVDPAGSALVAGQTMGGMDRYTSTGGLDGFLRKYGADGSETWTRYFGSRYDDYAIGVATDGAGAAYVSGSTDGAMSGGTSAGQSDAYARRYDAGGNEIWARQFGTPGFDDAEGIAVDGAGTVYVVGRTGGTFGGQASAGDLDAFARRYDGSGNELSTLQFGSPEADDAQGVAVDRAGNTHIVGGTFGSLPGQTTAGNRDAFVTKIAP
jgi:hypothetical protein